MLRGPLADRLTINGQTVGCLYYEETTWDDDGSGALVPMRARSAIIRTGSVAGIKEGLTATLTRTDTGVTTALQTRHVGPIEDGLLQRVWLA